MVLYSPKVAPSGLAASSNAIEMLNTDTDGSYIISSMISTVNVVVWPLAEPNIISDAVKLKSPAEGLQ